MLITTGTLSTATAALIVVLGLIYLASRAARASGLSRGRLGTTDGRRLVARESLVLDRVRRLHLIRCDDREVVVLTGGGTDVVVGWLTPGQVESGS